MNNTICITYYLNQRERQNKTVTIIPHVVLVFARNIPYVSPKIWL